MNRFLLLPFLFLTFVSWTGCTPGDQETLIPEMPQQPTNPADDPDANQESGNSDSDNNDPENNDSESNDQESSDGNQEDNPENNMENQEDNMESNQIKLTVGQRSFTATLVDNATTEALKQRLSQGSLELRMNDYGAMEKVGSLGFSLPRNDRPTSTKAGDIVLYQGNSLVIFYGSNSWSYTPIGKVDGVSTRAEMLALLGTDSSITVTISWPHERSTK